VVAVSKNATETAQYADLPRHEIKWCSVTLSEVVAAGKRLEASVFNPHGRHARAVVSACKWGNIPLCGDGGLATAYVCGRFKRVWLEKSDLPIYQPSSITDVYPEPDGYLSKNTRTNLDTLRVRKGQILLSCSGTIGKGALVSETLDDQIFSHDLIRMDAKSPVDVGYIYAFLRSKVGNTLLQTNNYGAVIQHIEPEHLDDIPVPNAPDEIKSNINDLIIRSFELRDESNELIDKATAMLVTELNLPSIGAFQTTRLDNGTNVNAFSVKLSELAGRLDGSYHLPIVKAITNHLRDNAAEVTTVGDKRVSKDIILPGRFKRVYVEEGQGREFFSGKNIMELDPYDKRYLSFSQHDKRIREQLTIHHNMILVTCSGTVGKVAFVPKHWENWAMTHDIIRLVPADDMAGYAFAWLQTEYARVLIEAAAYGSVVPHIEISHIEQISFPLLKNAATQSEINRLALEANELRYQAYELERDAMGVLENKVLSHGE
jgi:type I restriction enzyme S subunit